MAHVAIFEGIFRMKQGFFPGLEDEEDDLFDWKNNICPSCKRPRAGCTCFLGKKNKEGMVAVEKILRSHVGKASAISSKEIAKLLDIGDVEGQPKTRNLIKMVIRDRVLPILASGAGYFMAGNRDELSECVDSLQQRADQIINRIRLITEAYFQMENKTEEQAFEAGFDSGKNSPNPQNCHFSFFATPELKDEWERGRKAGREER